MARKKRVGSSGLTVSTHRKTPAASARIRPSTSHWPVSRWGDDSTRYSAPGGLGIRVDSAMEPNAVVVPYYDSLIAKLITHGRDRQEAMARMRRALDEFVIEGIKTTIPLHRKIFNDPDFQKGHVSTTFLDRFLAGQSA